MRNHGRGGEISNGKPFVGTESAPDEGGSGYVEEKKKKRKKATVRKKDLVVW